MAQREFPSLQFGLRSILAECYMLVEFVGLSSKIAVYSTQDKGPAWTPAKAYGSLSSYYKLFNKAK